MSSESEVSEEQEKREKQKSVVSASSSSGEEISASLEEKKTWKRGDDTLSKSVQKFVEKMLKVHLSKKNLKDHDLYTYLQKKLEARIFNHAQKNSNDYLTKYEKEDEFKWLLKYYKKQY